MRQFYQDVPYFITVPAIQHQNFFNTNEKKDILLESILIAQQKFNLKNLDFCLLKNHYHFASFFPDNRIIPQVVKQISGRSGKLLNKYENIKNRKIWDDYFIYYLDREDVYYKVRGYIIGNAYKHQEVTLLEDLKDYKYSTFNLVAKEIGIKEAEEMVLSSVMMSEEDLIRELKLKGKGSQTP
jgi:REP element-mobilizing transposase RayT